MSEEILKLRKDIVLYLAILLLQPQPLWMNVLLILATQLRVCWPELLEELDREIDEDAERERNRIPQYSEEVFDSSINSFDFSGVNDLSNLSDNDTKKEH